MTIPVGSCEIWFAYLLTGDPETMYWHIAYELTDAPNQTAVDAGFTDYQGRFKALATGDYSLLGGHVLVGSDPGTIRWDSGIAPIGGTGTGQACPQNVSYLVKKHTALGGRRNRGRGYIPGVPEGNVGAAGVLSGAAITAVNAALAFIKPGGATHTAFGFLGDAQLLHDTPPLTPTEITDLTVQPIVATQRRRLRH